MIALFAEDSEVPSSVATVKGLDRRPLLVWLIKVDVGVGWMMRLRERVEEHVKGKQKFYCGRAKKAAPGPASLSENLTRASRVTN